MPLDRRTKTSLLAILADLLLVGIKFAAALLTNSAALLADAYHSVSDLIVSLVLLAGLVTRAGQERRGTRKGIELAYRIEAGLAVLVSVLILAFPIEIVRDIRERAAQPVEYLWVGILAVMLCIAVAAFMARLKSTVGQETDSPALQADGQHSQLDVLSSVAVLASLIGLMVGIDIDVPVAIVIAILVASVGLELFAAGVRGLLNGQQIEQRSLVQLVLSFPPARSLLERTGVLFARLARPAPVIVLVMAALLLYLGSGLRQIPLGHQGVRETLFEAEPHALGPGLHYAAPWPFGGIRVYASDFVQSLSLSAGHRGTDSDAVSPVEAVAALWREEKTGNAAPAAVIGPGLATADENLVEVRFNLQYRLPARAQRLLVPEQSRDVLAAIARHAVSATVAGRSLEALRRTPLEQLSHEAQGRAERDLAAADVPARLLTLRVTAIQPPEAVVGAYREVADAVQNRQQMQRKAEATRTIDLARASAEQVAMEHDAAARAVEQRLQAQGEAARFAALAGVYGDYPEVIRLRRHLDTLVDSLSGRPLQIVDPAIRSDDLRAWRTPQP